MKYTYQGAVPQVVFAEDGLVTVSNGQVIDLPSAPSSEFTPVVPPKPKPKAQAKVKVAAPTPVKKKLPIKEEVKETRSK